MCLVTFVCTFVSRITQKDEWLVISMAASSNSSCWLAQYCSAAVRYHTMFYSRQYRQTNVWLQLFHFYVPRLGCVVLFTGWFHRCIRLATKCSSLMHQWNQPVNKTTHPYSTLCPKKGKRQIMQKWHFMSVSGWSHRWIVESYTCIDEQCTYSCFP